MDIFENGIVYEACAGVGMQMRGLDNAIKEIGLQPMTCVGISEVAPKAIIGYAVIHYGLTKEQAMDMTKDVPAETMAKKLTEKGIGQFEGTPNLPKPVNWMKKLKGKGLEYLRLVYAADKICHNDGDMTKVEKLPEGLTVFFSSSPCQSVSVAGKNAGFVKDSGTRSAIAWDVPRLIKSTADKPKVLIFENVKGMLSKGKVKGNGKNNFETFLEIVDEVEALGYNAYYKILNAKYCGVPQNRERVFFVAIRKDVDTKKFDFPKPFDCGVRLKDILQDKVDDIYYINSEKAINLIQQLYDKGELQEDVNPCDGTINNPHVKGISNCIKSRYDIGISNLGSDGTMVVEKKTPYILTDKGENFAHKADVACTLKARDWKGLDNMGSNGVVECTMSVNKYGNIYGGDKGGCFAGNVYDSNAISPALTTMEGGNRQPMIVEMKSKSVENGKFEQNKDDYVLIRQATTDGVIPVKVGGVADFSYPNLKTRRGRVQDNGDTCPTLSCETNICRIEKIPNEINKVGQISSDGSEYGTVVHEDGISVTLVAGTHGYANTCIVSQYRVRKLTPEECFVLMGLDVDDCTKCREIGLVNTDLYKIAGNGLVTNCISLIIEHLYKANVDESYICEDELYETV